MKAKLIKVDAMKQTAIEWLVETLAENGILHSSAIATSQRNGERAKKRIFQNRMEFK
jgi:hypothetical protein